VRFAFAVYAVAIALWLAASAEYLSASAVKCRASVAFDSGVLAAASF
jgi:hypothetical protein